MCSLLTRISPAASSCCPWQALLQHRLPPPGYACSLAPPRFPHGMHPLLSICAAGTPPTSPSTCWACGAPPAAPTTPAAWACTPRVRQLMPPWLAAPAAPAASAAAASASTSPSTHPTTQPVSRCPPLVISCPHCSFCCRRLVAGNGGPAAAADGRGRRRACGAGRPGAGGGRGAQLCGESAGGEN